MSQASNSKLVPADSGSRAEIASGDMIVCNLNLKKLIKFKSNLPVLFNPNPRPPMFRIRMAIVSPPKRAAREVGVLN